MTTQTRHGNWPTGPLYFNQNGPHSRSVTRTDTYQCEKCGAIVGDELRHGAWHEGIDPKSVDSGSS